LEDAVVEECQDKYVAVIPAAGDLVLGVKAKSGRTDVIQEDCFQEVGLGLEVLVEDGFEPSLGRRDGKGSDIRPDLLPDLETFFLEPKFFFAAGGGFCLSGEISDPDELSQESILGRSNSSLVSSLSSREARELSRS